MAFNPFHTFSVRSRTGKSVLAVLTIVVMFMFVLSSGAVGSGMDFFDQLGSLFGGSTHSRGEVVARAYGDDVRDSELGEVRRQRAAAREYLSRALDVSYTKWARDLDADVKAGRLTADVKDFVGRFAALRVKADTERRPYDGFLLQFVNTQQFGQDLFKFMDAWRKAQAKPDSDDKKAMDAVVSIMVNDLSRLTGQSPLYLVPLSTESDRDVLDFILLLKSADRLGINFSKDGVRDLVARDTGGRLSQADFSTIENDLRNGGRSGAGLSADWLAEAIENEYRAKVALSALEGKPLVAELMREQRTQAFRMLTIFGVNLSSTRAPGELATATAIAGGMTPYEFFEFYKDRCSEYSFDVLEIRAEQFLDQVKEAPTKAELNALFAKYRGELPDPSRDRPGFKEPKKVKVEFVTLEATAPRIAQAVPRVEAAGAFLQVTTGVLSGDPMVACVNAARPDAAAGAPTAPVDQAAREIVRARREENLSKYNPLELWNFTPRDTSIFRPQPIISALGVLAGQPDFATFIAATAAVHQQVERLDHQTRVPFLLQAVLTPFNPTMGNALGMPALAYAHNPKLPPEGLYLPEALANARKDQVRNLFREDIHQLQEKLRKITEGDETPMAFPPPKPDKAKLEKNREEAKKYLAEWLKARGLTPAGNPAPDDQWAVAADPALKPLNDLAVPEADGTNTLSKKLFAEPQMQFMDAGPKPFQPFWFPGDPAGASLDKPNQLVWVTQETEARAIGNNLDNADKLTNGEMSKRVERAWRLDKARALAKAEADRLAEQVKTIAKGANGNRGAIDMQLRDLAADKKAREFELDRLALLKFEHGLNPSQQGYKPSTVEKTQVLYPTPDFVNRLLELRKDPVGAVTVLPDAPRTRYYVACLAAKFEKTVDQFREVFDKANAVGMAQNPLYLQYALPEEQLQAMNDARLRLRADAGLELKEAFTKRERKEEE